MQKMKNNKNVKIILIFFLSFTLRIAFLIFSDYPEKALKFYDAPSWDTVAWNILQKGAFLEINGQPTSVRPPVYPLFLSIIYYFFGRNYNMVFVVQTIMSSFTNIIIFLLLCKLFEERISFLSAMICSLWHGFVVYSVILTSETLYIFLFSLYLYRFYNAYVNDKWKDYIFSGVLLGVANLTRSTMIFFLLFLIGSMFILKYSYDKICKVFVTFVISMIVVLPWTIRNYRVFNRFLLVNTSAGELFWSGTYLPWDGVCKHNRDEKFFEMFNLENPVDNERKMFKEGLKNIRENPKGFLKLSIKKFFRFWFKPIGEEILKEKSIIFSYVLYFIQIFIVSFFWYFLVRNFKNEIFLPILVLSIYFTIMHNLLAPIPRYRLPLEIIILSFSLVGVKEFIFSLVFKKNEKGFVA